MSRRRFLVSMLFTATFSASLPASADDAERRAAAQALFDEGRRLMREAAHASACAKFQASYELDPGLGTLLHEADCYEKVGRLASAWATFELAVQVAEERADVERGQVARVRAASLELRLPRIAVELTDRPSGTELRIDGRGLPESSIGALLPLDPGQHRIEVRAPRHRTIARTVRVRVGDDPLIVRVPALVPAPETTMTPVPPAKPSPRADARADRTAAGGTQKLVGIGVVGMGLVGLAAGGALAIAAHQKNQTSFDECRASDTTLCSERGVDLREQAQSLAGWSTGALLAGASLFGIGAVIYLTSGGSDDRDGIALTLGPTSWKIARRF
jgi:hypothetical protein